VFEETLLSPSSTTLLFLYRQLLSLRLQHPFSALHGDLSRRVLEQCSFSLHSAIAFPQEPPNTFLRRGPRRHRWSRSLQLSRNVRDPQCFAGWDGGRISIAETFCALFFTGVPFRANTHGWAGGARAAGPGEGDNPARAGRLPVGPVEVERVREARRDLRQCGGIGRSGTRAGDVGEKKW
jgi:hypothetical protein